MDIGRAEEGSDGWDEFVSRANELINSGNLVKWEIEYKLVIGGKVAAAREAVLFGSDSWVDSLKTALLPLHPIAIQPRDNLIKWCRNHPVKASEALKSIWSGSDSPASIAERVRVFSEKLPQEVVAGKQSRGTRTTVASALLMGLDIERYPPYTTEKFKSAYESTDYGQPKQGADEATLYEYALGFLDQLIIEARAHGVHLRHRLDAQSLVWQFLSKPNQLGKLPKLSSRPPAKTLQALAEELLLNDSTVPFLEEIETLLYDKHQVIFQGPPGTGKTFVAQALANCLARSEDRVTLVQFHPSYAYEDFVRGFRPTITENGQAGFELQDGPLLRAAREARKEPDAKHFLIIDEINRGNLAKVFGELYFLLEYRDKKIRMQYQKDNEEDFSLPRNLYIIGTMNTADRSIALVDLALRRRFYFIEFHPDDEPVKGVLGRWLEKQGLQEMTWVADVVEKANELLQDDKHAAIGPSYFMKECLDKKIVERIWKHSVIPYIEERIFGDEDRIREFDFEKLCAKVAPELLPNDGEEQTGR